MHMNIFKHTKSAFRICVSAFDTVHKKKENISISNPQHIFIFMANSVTFDVGHIFVCKIVESYSNAIHFLHQSSSDCAQFFTRFTESYLNNLMFYTRILNSTEEFRKWASVDLYFFNTTICTKLKFSNSFVSDENS